MAPTKDVITGKVGAVSTDVGRGVATTEDKPVDLVGVLSDRGVVETFVESGIGGERREEEFEVGVECAIDGVICYGLAIMCVVAFKSERLGVRSGDVEDEEEEKGQVEEEGTHGFTVFKCRKRFSLS